MKQSFRVAFWIALYLILVTAPLFALLIGPTPPGREFWRELSVALGFAGLSIMGFQFLITARIPRIEAPYGMDIIYEFHRQISWVASILILAHLLILFVFRPSLLQLLNVFNAPWRARFGMASIVALVALIVTSIWRSQLRLNYEAWRIGHGILGTAAIAFAMLHISLVNYYVALPYKRALWLSLAAFWVGLLVYVRIVKPFMMLRRPYVVTTVRPERGEAHTIELLPEGHAGFGFKPGQFAWLTLWNSPFSIMEHPFSISSAATERRGKVAFTIKPLGDSTATVAGLRPGSRAYIDGPYGAFSIDRHHPADCVFIAGGVGITPVMSMLRTMADRQDKRKLLLIYGSNRWDDIIFREELEEVASRLNLKIEHVLANPPANWRGETGFITYEVLKRLVPAPLQSLDFYICGSDQMMDAVESALVKHGVPLSNIESERFNFV